MDVLTDKELEKRRRIGFKLLRAGMKQSHVAKRLGVAQQSVHLWAKKLRNEGQSAWQTCRRGAKSRLSTEQLNSALLMISDGPDVAGIPTDYWTIALLRREIRQRWGVTYRRTRIIELLQQAGFAARRREGRWRPATEG